MIDTTDTDTNPNNNYAGVYVGNSKLEGLLIGEVEKLSLQLHGGPVVGGSPRFSIPIDTDGDGTTEAYASSTLSAAMTAGDGGRDWRR